MVIPGYSTLLCIGKCIESSKKMLTDEKNLRKKVEKYFFLKNQKYYPSTKTYPKDNF